MQIKVIFLILLFFPMMIFAHNQVPSGYPCSDAQKICADTTPTKIISGVKISKPCWKYEYRKVCDYPSRNDCQKIAHCYDYGQVECILHDSLGNCVNEKKRFVCKEWNFEPIKRERLKQELKGNEAKRIVCKGIPCIDGNCVDKSYAMNGEMMESVSQLYAVGQMKDAGKVGADIFRGTHDVCRKKPVGTMNCCKVGGWLKPLGANCTPDEESLKKKRNQNLCIWVGKVQSGKKPVHVNKHHFCCFGNLFTKVFQIQARKQLNRGFGSGGNLDCRGITLEEIVKLDFEKMDFSEFVHQIQKNMKLPNIGDLKSRVQDTFTPMDSKYKQIEENPHPEDDLKSRTSGIDEKVMQKVGVEGDY